MQSELLATPGKRSRCALLRCRSIAVRRCTEIVYRDASIISGVLDYPSAAHDTYSARFALLITGRHLFEAVRSIRSTILNLTGTPGTFWRTTRPMLSLSSLQNSGRATRSKSIE